MLNMAPEILKLFSKANQDIEFIQHGVSKKQQLQGLRHGEIVVVFNLLLSEKSDLKSEEVISKPALITPTQKPPASQ